VPETRWIAASVALLPPSNDKEEGTHGPFQEENRIPFK